MREYLIGSGVVESTKCITLKDGPSMQKISRSVIPFAEILDFKEYFLQKHIIITSTSWTDDEKMEILLDALELYSMNTKNPDVVVFITGDGKNRAEVTSMFAESTFPNITIITAWLTITEYFGLLSTHHDLIIRVSKPRHMSTLVDVKSRSSYESSGYDWL